MQSTLAVASLGVSGSADALLPEAVATQRPLYLAIYRPGPAWLVGKPTSEQPLREHGRYMLELHKQGRLRFAGGFADNLGGAAAFEAENDDAAQSIVDADPAVISGVMVCTVQRWRLVDWANVEV